MFQNLTDAQLVRLEPFMERKGSHEPVTGPNHQSK
jgi:hypothetical protein